MHTHNIKWDMNPSLCRKSTGLVTDDGSFNALMDNPKLQGQFSKIKSSTG